MKKQLGFMKKKNSVIFNQEELFAGKVNLFDPELSFVNEGEEHLYPPSDITAVPREFIEILDVPANCNYIAYMSNVSRSGINYMVETTLDCIEASSIEDAEKKFKNAHSVKCRVTVVNISDIPQMD